MGGLSATAKNLVGMGRDRKPREQRKKKAIRRLSKDETAGVESDIGMDPGSLQKRKNRGLFGTVLGGVEETL